MRSYQDNVLGKLYFSFPNDIHFYGAKMPTKEFKKINNKCENFSNIILNGYSHISFQKSLFQILIKMKLIFCLWI